MSEATDNTATDHAEAQAEADRPNNSLIFVIVIATLFSIVAVVLFVNEVFKSTMEHEISTKVLEPPNSTLRGLRATEKERLGRYQWADEKKGIVRIPVDQAVALTLKDYQEQRVRPAATPPVIHTIPHDAQPADGAAKPDEGAAPGEPSKAQDAAKPGDKDAAKPSDAKPVDTATPAKPADTAKPADAVKPAKPADAKPAQPGGAAPKPAAPATPAPEQ
ncbi:hypothetical protein WME90_39695 [Sorangium sp. So ce375]|uniref:hypothetical protein n=1 Tax=Sorangium sp. So ce375 TaxID=3133306 RepID=UPI003F5BF50C